MAKLRPYQKQMIKDLNRAPAVCSSTKTVVQAERDALYQATMIRVMLGFNEAHTLGAGWAFGLPPSDVKAARIARANEVFIAKYGNVTELYQELKK